MTFPLLVSTVYWIAGAQTCFLITAATFIVPLVLLSRAGRLKEEWHNLGNCVLRLCSFTWFYDVYTYSGRTSTNVKKKKDVPWMLVVIGHFYEALHCNQVIFFCLQALKGGRRVINSFRSIIIIILLKFILSVNCRFTIVQLKCVDILFSI